MVKVNFMFKKAIKSVSSIILERKSVELFIVMSKTFTIIHKYDLKAIKKLNLKKLFTTIMKSVPLFKSTR